jgi:hypothetical protein
MIIRFKNWLLQESRVDLTLYHGTHANFDQFDYKLIARNQDYGYYGFGIYLTPNPRLAKYYGSKVYKCHVVLDNPLMWDKGTTALYEKYGIEGSPSDNGSLAKELTEKMKNDGYDSIIVIGTGAMIAEVCAFDAKQITILDKQSDVNKEYEDFLKKRS